MHDSTLNRSLRLKFASKIFYLWIQIYNSKVNMFLIDWFMTFQKSKNVNEKIKSLQVISKERVSNFGEVYTSEKEVNDMLNLVQDQIDRIDSRFLEPACGNGNFLSEIL